jgi:hypothetical protein
VKNPKFNWLLSLQKDARGERMTVAKLAEQIHSSRSHVTMVLGNMPGRGHHTRRKLAPLLNAAMLQALGWDRIGQMVPRGTSQSSPNGKPTNHKHTP